MDINRFIHKRSVIHFDKSDFFFDVQIHNHIFCYCNFFYRIFLPKPFFLNEHISLFIKAY